MQKTRTVAIAIETNHAWYVLFILVLTALCGSLGMS